MKGMHHSASAVVAVRDVAQLPAHKLEVAHVSDAGDVGGRRAAVRGPGPGHHRPRRVPRPELGRLHADGLGVGVQHPRGVRCVFAEAELEFRGRRGKIEVNKRGFISMKNLTLNE